MEREIALHSRLCHRNIVAFHTHFADRDHVYMVLEYCSRQVAAGGAMAVGGACGLLVGGAGCGGSGSLSTVAPCCLRHLSVVGHWSGH